MESFEKCKEKGIKNMLCWLTFQFGILYSRLRMLQKHLHSVHVCFRHWAGSAGTMGLVWNNRRRLLPKGSAKKNICMRSRQWREWAKVKGGRRKKERILALHSDKKTKLCFGKHKVRASSIKRVMHIRTKWVTKRGTFFPTLVSRLTIRYFLYFSQRRY